VQQIADWLGQLGLGQYSQRLAENEIDVSVLRHLTDQDLKDIGIPLDRRRGGVEIGADEVASLLGIKLRGNAGRTYQIAEHHRWTAT
jgi:hypothetical protein